jgi:hypothetical protein
LSAAIATLRGSVWSGLGVEFIRRSYPVHFQPKEGSAKKGGETTRIAKVPENASGRDTIAPDETAASHER